MLPCIEVYVWTRAREFLYLVLLRSYSALVLTFISGDLITGGQLRQICQKQPNFTNQTQNPIKYRIKTLKKCLYLAFKFDKYNIGPCDSSEKLKKPKQLTIICGNGHFV